MSPIFGLKIYKKKSTFLTYDPIRAEHWEGGEGPLPVSSLLSSWSFTDSSRQGPKIKIKKIVLIYYFSGRKKFKEITIVKKIIGLFSGWTTIRGGEVKPPEPLWKKTFFIANDKMDEIFNFHYEPRGLW